MKITIRVDDTEISMEEQNQDLCFRKIIELARIIWLGIRWSE